MRLSCFSSGRETKRCPQASDQGSTVDDREQVRRAEPRNGAHGQHSAQARYRAATSTVQFCATLAEHGGCVIATVSELPRRMRNSRSDPQERIPYG